MRITIDGRCNPPAMAPARRNISGELWRQMLEQQVREPPPNGKASQILYRCGLVPEIFLAPAVWRRKNKFCAEEPLRTASTISDINLRYNEIPSAADYCRQAGNFTSQGRNHRQMMLSVYTGLHRRDAQIIENG